MLIPTIVVIVLALIVGAVVFIIKKGQPEIKEATTKPKNQEQQDSVFIQRLCYLMKIVIEHSNSDRRESSIREVVRIGEEVHEKGGFRYMVKIHETVTQQTSPKVGARLKALWKGVGDWRA